MEEPKLNDPLLCLKLALADTPIQPKSRRESRSGRYWRTVQWRHGEPQKIPERQEPDRDTDRE